MLKAKRMTLAELFGGGHGVKDVSGLQKILAKAEEIEMSKLEKFD